MTMLISSMTSTLETRVISVTDAPPFRNVEVHSERLDAGGWSVPQVFGLGEQIDRSEWETFKKMVDAAFNAFEERFPAA
jgi:hypothetical protein